MKKDYSEKIEFPLAMMGDLDERVMFDTYCTPEEKKEFENGKIKSR